MPRAVGEAHTEIIESPVGITRTPVIVEKPARLSISNEAPPQTDEVYQLARVV